ncbi:NUDIX hydrolase [Sulfobacillus thermosulfidooxidans]|uniref:NUDIX hydrolase n=1 Tax=Sulfobacillus thermosulfidooxidans TaxID=28034 RepID=UPI0009E9509C|nr:NUDIX domain-containing protein [Sulfobacillus thermosulfidooxidans]
MPRPKPPSRPVKIPDLYGHFHEFSPQNIRFRPAAYGVLVHDQQILLSLSRFSGKWDLPGGGIEPWESLETGLTREFFEETGLMVHVQQFLGLRESFIAFFHYPFHSLRFYYQVEKNAASPSQELKPEPHELLDLKWWPLDQIPLSQMNTDDISIIQHYLQGQNPGGLGKNGIAEHGEIVPRCQNGNGDPETNEQN